MPAALATAMRRFLLDPPEIAQAADILFETGLLAIIPRANSVEC